jgi:ubiquinone/menaquinone biosynthesis C-methylase UbiE
MTGLRLLREFTDRTARKPEGRWARRNYSNPREHRYSFRIIMEALCLNEDDIYCEIGCGGGALLNMAMAKAKRGAAIDHSKEMVELSRENNQRYVEEGRLEVLQGRAEQLPWESGVFTACASANMFFFVENPQAMLSEVFRVLKRRGRFSMVTMGDGLFGKMTFGWLYSLRTYSDREMMSMLKLAGFSEIRAKSTATGLIQICYGTKA